MTSFLIRKGWSGGESRIKKRSNRKEMRGAKGMEEERRGREWSGGEGRKGRTNEPEPSLDENSRAKTVHLGSLTVH